MSAQGGVDVEQGVNLPMAKPLAGLAAVPPVVEQGSVVSGVDWGWVRTEEWAQDAMDAVRRGEIVGREVVGDRASYRIAH